jgi:tRNA(Ile)-lysidine synthase
VGKSLLINRGKSCRIGEKKEIGVRRMIRRVASFVDKNKMLHKRDKVVVGVSGGADSVCLFFVLLELRKKYQLELYVVHVNHGLRGKEANLDEEFVKALCQSYQVSFTSVKADVKKLVKDQGLSEEEAGRNIRYEAFYQICETFQCQKIAIAHNENDQAETVLFHLFRGSGIKGLTGISAVRGKIIRPLLCISREEIEEYLALKKIEYQTDQTNLSLIYSRNKIRLKVLPYVSKEINYKATKHIVQAAAFLTETERYIEKNTLLAFERIVKSHNGIYFFSKADFFAEDIVIQRRIVRKIIERLVNKLRDIEAEHIDMVISLGEKQVGKQVDLPYGICATREYENITIYLKRECAEIEKNIDEKSIEVLIPGKYMISWVKLNISFEIVDYKKNMIIPKNNCTKWFDYDKIKNAIFIRKRQSGDFIQIDSKGNCKKIKSYFIDKKVPREERAQIPLLADGKHIMWVIGHRISEGYKVDQETRKILIVKIVGGTQDDG